MPQINGTIGKWIRILNGARQGCGLSPEFPNAHGEETKKNRGEDLVEVRVGGHNINSLRFADDATLLSDSQQKYCRNCLTKQPN